MKHKLQKIDIDQLQEQRKWKIKNQLQTSLLKLENKFKNIEQIEMDSIPTIKKLGQLKKKAQVPIGQAGRVRMNTKVNSERPGSTFKLPPSQIQCSPLSINNKVTYENE